VGDDRGVAETLPAATGGAPPASAPELAEGEPPPARATAAEGFEDDDFDDLEDLVYKS
jgi:hypothetical protein